MAPAPRVVDIGPRISEETPVVAGARVPFRTLIDHLELNSRLDRFYDSFPLVSRAQALAAWLDA